jgi:hypothetical protein
MSKAWHYLGALLVVVAGVWIAGVIGNPLSNIKNNPK